MLLAPLGLKGHSPCSLITPNGGSLLVTSARKLAESASSKHRLSNTLVWILLNLNFGQVHIEKYCIYTFSCSWVYENRFLWLFMSSACSHWPEEPSLITGNYPLLQGTFPFSRELSPSPGNFPVLQGTFPLSRELSRSPGNFHLLKRLSPSPGSFPVLHGTFPLSRELSPSPGNFHLLQGTLSFAREP